MSYILFFCFIFSVIFLFFTKEPMQADSYSYDAIGLHLAQGDGYVNESHALTMEREPLYPFFLALIYRVFGHRYFFVQIIQIALFLLTVVLIYKTSILIFDNRIAIYSMAITGFFPTLANYPSYVLSEALFTFLLSLLVFGCIKIYFTDKLIYYLLTGVVLAMSALCKVVMTPFIFIIILWLIFFKRNTKSFTVRISVMILIYISLIAPWMCRNYVNFGTFSLREGSEMCLSIKAQKLNYGLDDFKQNLVFIISENLGKKMFPSAVENPRDFLFKEDNLVRGKILPELKEKGYNVKQINNMMITRIIKSPVKFLAISALDMFKMTQFSYVPILIDQRYLIEKIESFKYGGFILSLLRGLFRFLAYLIILFSVIGMFFTKNAWRKWIFLFILIGYINLAHALIYGHGRYAVPIIPYYVILSVPVILAIKERIFRCGKEKGVILCQK